MKNQKFYLFGIGALTVLTGLAFYISAIIKPYTYNGSTMNPPQPAPDFALKDTHGQVFHLGAQKGRLILLFFGYSSCPDECPATLAVLKQVNVGLGQAASKVSVVFVTIDPNRDRPSVLQTYLAKFDPTFIGLTGSSLELQPVWNLYGVYIAQTDSGPLAGYRITHSNRVYLIDSQGDFSLTYSSGISPGEIIQDIQHLLS